MANVPRRFYDDVRHSILGSANLIPVVGGALSYFAGLFKLNSGESPEQMWMRLIDGKISDALMRVVQRDLVGLSNVTRLYKTTVETGNHESILAQSIAANTQFTAMVPGFQIQGEESTLLPLFAIAATLHLALLRDMVLKGKEIGMADAHVARLADDMIALIEQYSRYVDTYVAAAIDRARRDHPNGEVWYRRNMPLSAMLDTKAYYQIAVIDFRDTWNHFDPIRFPGPSIIKLDREIFTPVLGWWDAASRPPDVIPAWKAPQSPLTALKVWNNRAWRVDWVYGFESTYADGSTMTSGTKTNTVYDLKVARQIDEVVMHYLRGMVHMNFRADEIWKGTGGTIETNMNKVTSSFPGHRLSSIRAIGREHEASKGAVSGCVLGFQLVDQL